MDTAVDGIGATGRRPCQRVRHIMLPDDFVSPSLSDQACETAWSLSGRHTGRTDIALTEQGERQSRMLRERLRGRTFSLVLTSPLQRARRTRELAGFGASGQTFASGTMAATRACARPTSATSVPAGACSKTAVPRARPRTTSACGPTASSSASAARGGDVLLFAHGHILRVIAARWLGFAAVEGRRLLLSPATLCVLGYDHDPEEPVIRTWNEALERGIRHSA